MFRDRPLFKLTNGDYVIYNRSFLIDRLYSSLYFDFKKIVDGGTRSDAGESMPGNALFLWEVKY